MRAEGTAPENVLRRLEQSERFEVCGVFSSGIYCADIEQNMIMLHDEKYGRIPFGIAVPDFGREGRNLGVEPGMTAVYADGVFSAPDAGMEIRVRTARCAEGETPPGPDDFLQHAEKVLKKSGKSALSYYAFTPPGERRKNDVEDLFASAAFSGMEKLDRGLAEGNAETLREALSGLIGLGRGLTPSCDDYLCGMLAAFRCLSETENRAGELFSLLSAEIPGALSATNIYSAAYLKAAAAGENFSVMRACLCSSGEIREESLRQLTEVGGSSGSDMLSGMCRACEILKLA